jgi:predicted DNA-binding transcriptional regulator AlpA
MMNRASDTQQTGPAVGALAVGAKKAAELVDVSSRTWARWDSAGKCPRGFKLGGSVLWRVADIQAWAAMGFPDRKAFEAVLDAVEAKPQDGPS